MSVLRELWHDLHGILSQLLSWVEAFAATSYGGWALFGLAFLESSIFPVPPDVLLIALCLGRPDLSFWFAAICAVGSVLGGMAGYALGYYGGRPLLLKPPGTDIPGRPARLVDRVKMSERYMASVALTRDDSRWPFRKANSYDLAAAACLPIASAVWAADS